MAQIQHSEGTNLPPELTGSKVVVKGMLTAGNYLATLACVAEGESRMRDGKTSRWLRFWFRLDSGPVVGGVMSHITSARVSENARKHPALGDIVTALGSNPATIADTNELVGRTCSLYLRDGERFVDVVDIQPSSHASKAVQVTVEHVPTQPAQQAANTSTVVTNATQPVCPYCAQNGFVTRFKDTMEMNAHIQNDHKLMNKAVR